MPGISPRPNFCDNQMQSGADDWELVLRESQHRMKNTLMLLGASVRRSFSGTKPEGLSAAVDQFERRIVAFGRLYQLLSSGDDHQTIVVADFFEGLCEAMIEAILVPVSIHCEAVVERGALPAVQCHRIGLIVAELVTNAAKHAFPDKQGALVRVEALHRDGCWSFTVTDNGIGATGSPQNIGGRIVQSLARSIRAKVYGQTGPDGTTVTIALPTFD
jgi:two-component sensor histidine kinase